MLRVSKAILHVFDFETGTKHFSDTALDLEDRQTRSYVQRRLRKITSNPESRHGEFAEKSNFAGGLQEYAHGDFGFVEFSAQIAQWFWENLRKVDETEQCDLLVADYLNTDAATSADTADEASDGDDAFDGDTRRLFAIVLLPRKQAFVHDVSATSNEILRQDATLPSPTQKVDTYAVIDLGTGSIDFHDHERLMAGQACHIMSELFLQCSSEASSQEVISEVTGIVQELAEEYNLEPAVEVSRAKAAVAAAVEVHETVDPVNVGRQV
ncbi:MAG: nucleoid-associated protein, partial [Lancefieldella sp.]